MLQRTEEHVTAQSVHKDLEFDGLWIDMNEPSNYCTGDVCWNDGEGPSTIKMCNSGDILCHQYSMMY